MKKIIIAILALGLILFSVSCTNEKQIPEPLIDEPVIEEKNTDTVDPAAGIILAGADEAKQIDISSIKSIELFDLDNTLVEKTFTETEVATLGNAYNESMIDDISYIEMLAGYSMIITLDTDQTIHITSYGNENNIVATTNGTTYHLICPEIGKLLLSGSPQ
ncbi:MAG: hypothetical protein CVU84_00615 [Firmicutes bacterium HGW-Firmicutes-1]|jgi:hypothetical protein|nr:MAG: hypothetical protein CVU84_00615 [Firmicutes bacterium HGW-Firmicutes-1]